MCRDDVISCLNRSVTGEGEIKCDHISFRSSPTIVRTIHLVVESVSPEYIFLSYHHIMLRRDTKSKVSNRQKLYSFCLILIIFTLVHDKYSQKMLGASRNDQVLLSSLDTKVDLTPTVETPKLSLSPSTKDVIINIGSNIDPIMPPEDMGPCAHTIAVEPIVSCEFSHQQLSVIPAAVADQAGVMTMNVLNKKHSVSSSLAEVKANDWRLKGGTRKIVPVITLTSLLDSIPSTVNIAMMMTDIQGYDFRTVKAGAKAVKERVTHLVTEVSKEDKYSYDTQNDLCRDWIPFMEELGTW